MTISYRVQTNTDFEINKYYEPRGWYNKYWLNFMINRNLQSTEYFCKIISYFIKYTHAKCDI